MRAHVPRATWGQVKTHARTRVMAVFAVFINRAAPGVGCVNFLHFWEFFFLLKSSLAPASGHAHAHADGHMQTGVECT